MRWFRSRACYLWDMKANGMKFAILGPFRLVLEPITFQRLCAVSVGVREGKQRMLGQIRSNLLPLLSYARRAGLQEK